MLFFRYDYENCNADLAAKMMTETEAQILQPTFVQSKLTYENKVYIVKSACNYSYVDPIDGSKAMKQVSNRIFPPLRGH